MIVLLVAAPAQFGGLERVVLMLANGLQRRGHGVHVVAVLGDAEPHPLVDALRAAGVSTVPVFAPARGYLLERAAVRRLCRSLRPAIVHTHGYRPDVVDAGVARALGIPVVSTLHGFTGGDGRNRFYEWLQRRAVRRADGVVAVSRPMADALRRQGIRPDRLRMIRNAWTPPAQPPLDRATARESLGLSPHDFVAGWVGRLSAEKGPDVFVDALDLLRDGHVVGCVLGDGSAREALESRAARLGLRDSVRWCGHVPDAERLYAAFDCFVLSSRTEGTPIALFEAMAAGVPIVATTVGGVPDVVTSGEALLVPPESAAALATAIRGLRSEPRAATARATAARRRLEREFGLDPWLDQYERLYEEVRAGRQGS